MCIAFKIRYTHAALGRRMHTNERTYGPGQRIRLFADGYYANTATQKPPQKTPASASTTARPPACCIPGSGCRTCLHPDW